MGKGTRNQQKHAMEYRKQQKLNEEKAIRRKKNKVWAISVSSVVALALAVVLTISCIDTARVNSGYYIRNATAASTENISVDGAVMSYFIYEQVNSYLSYFNNLYLANYTSSFDSFTAFLSSALSLDTSKSLKSQKYSGSDTQTWFDYFLSLAKESVSDNLILLEAARAAGVTLTDAEKAAIKDRAAKYTAKDFGTGVKTEDIEKGLLIESLASKYKNSVLNGFEKTDEEISAAFEADKNKYTYVDYRGYSITYGGTEEGAYTSEQAMEKANALAETKTVEEYLAWISTEIGVADGTPTSSQQSTLDSTLKTKSAYSDTELNNWLFAADTAVYSTKVINSVDSTDGTKGTVTVYMFVTAPYKDTAVTRNVRQILITASSGLTDEEAKQKAEDILQKWNDGERTESSFGDLAFTYSEDTGSTYNYGLYNRVRQGEMTTEFDEWLFDEERKAGDTAVVKTTYGYHVMLYTGESYEQWAADVFENLITEDYDTWYSIAEKGRSVTYTQATIDLIKA